MKLINRIVVFIFCVRFTNGKDIAVQSQVMINICRCIVAPLNRNSRQDLDFSSCESLVSTISRQFRHSFFYSISAVSFIQIYVQFFITILALVQFVWNQCQRTVTFAYIMMFHFPSELTTSNDFDMLGCTGPRTAAVTLAEFKKWIQHMNNDHGKIILGINFNSIPRDS